VHIVDIAFSTCCSVSRTDAVDLLRVFVKQLYDLRMSSGTAETTNHLLPELYIDNFDNEQIFQQLEMFNNHVVEEHRRAVKAIQTCKAAAKVKNSSLSRQLPGHMLDESWSVKKQVTFESDSVPDLAADAVDSVEEEEVETDSNVDSEEDSALKKLLDSMKNKTATVQNNSIDDNVDDDDDDDDDEDSEAELNADSSDDDSDTDNDRTASKSQRRTMLKQKNYQVSAVDDRFFKLSEIEAFLDEQDLKEQRQHSSNADDTEDDDDYDLSADEKVIQFFC